MMSITNIYGFRIYQNFLLGAVAIVYLMLEILEANTLKEYPRYPGPRPGEFQMPSKFFILNAASFFRTFPQFSKPESSPESISLKKDRSMVIIPFSSSLEL